MVTVTGQGDNPIYIKRFSIEYQLHLAMAVGNFAVRCQLLRGKHGSWSYDGKNPSMDPKSFPLPKMNEFFPCKIDHFKRKSDLPKPSFFSCSNVFQWFSKKKWVQRKQAFNQKKTWENYDTNTSPGPKCHHF